MTDNKRFDMILIGGGTGENGVGRMTAKACWKVASADIFGALKASDFELIRQILMKKRIELQRLSEASNENRNPVELEQTSVGRLSRMDVI